jgi:hypothetical protein
MRSCRVVLEDLAIDEVAVDTAYADLFVVVREGDEEPGPSDWEATVRTSGRQHLRPGRYVLRATTLEGHPIEGAALLRFSDGQRHLFRGDGRLAGVALVVG